VKRNRANFTLYPLAFLAASFACGTVASNLFEIHIFVAAALLLMFAGLAAFVRNSWASYLIVATFFILGSFCYQMETRSIADDRVKTLFEEGRLVSGESVELEGVLRSAPEPAYGGAYLEVAMAGYSNNGETQPASGTVKLFVQLDSDETRDEFRQLDLHYGARIRTAVRLKREEEYQNPGVVSRIKILDQQGIDATGSIKSPLLIQHPGDDAVFLPLAWIHEQRADLIEKFHTTFRPSTAGVLIASLLGDKHFLDKPTADVFREGGTFHVLVISGLHITFVGALALLLVRLFTRKRLWQFLFADAFLWAYTFAVGAEVPVVRATLMFTILSFSFVIYRKGSLLNSFGLCGLMMLAWRPSDLFSTSFQLTFASVGAIVLAAFPLIRRLREIGCWTPTSGSPFPPNVPERLRRFCEMLYWRKRVWDIESSRNIWSANLFKSPYLPRIGDTATQTLFAYLFEGLLVSLIVQIWLLPLLVIYFHRVTPGSLAINLWVGFFIAIESISAVVAVAASSISGALALPFVYLTEAANWLIVSVPGIAVDTFWMSDRIPNYSGVFKAVYAVYYVPVLALSIYAFCWNPFELKRSTRRTYYAAVTLLSTLGLIIFFHPFSSPRANGRLTVNFLDVGQGDSALVTFPNGETMLIDGGGRRSFKVGEADDADEPAFEPDTPTIGEAVVSPFLWEKGYSKIDYILATHADADHIQGLTAVAANFRVRCAFFGRMPDDDPEFAELADMLRRRGIPWRQIAGGDRMTIGGVDVDVLYPDLDDSFAAVSDNDHSVVLRLGFGNRHFLFTGDIESRTERLLTSSGNALLADTIKVPHHGSRTSSTPEFVSSVRPSLAVISVGRHSMFGHPDREIVKRWQDAAMQVFITGSSGTVTVSTDGNDLKASTFVKP
jgi:competence protein ComEC